MRYRPHLPEGALAALLAEHFGLPGAVLTFLPVGEDGWVYRVEGGDGSQWLLKLNQHPAAVNLALTQSLCTVSGLDWIPAPRAALNGSLEVECQGLYLSVQAFIQGRVLMDQPPDAGQVGRIGGMLAELHRAGQLLPAELRGLLPVESYTRHQNAAARVLAWAVSGAVDGEIQAELAGFILGRQALIGKILAGCLALGDQIRWRSPGLVLCHADIHQANIIQDPAGKLWVIDWDGIMLAPPERDLLFWHDSPFWAAFTAGYGLKEPVDDNLIRYYAYEWVAQEIADYGENVFFLPLSDEQKLHSLAEFTALFEPGNVVESALNA